MIGSRASPTINCKAAETKHLFFFTVDFLARHVGKVHPSCGDAQALLDSGVALKKWCHVLTDRPNAHERFVPPHLCDELEGYAALHCQLAIDAGIGALPKHHAFRHLTEDIRRKGDPRHYHTYCDESLNGLIAKIASSCHRARFERMIFRKWGYLQSGSLVFKIPRPPLLEK
jgi:hypothetical protein